MSKYEISKSSLLSLKAEILRKQEELSKAKADNEVKIRNLKKNSSLDLKNKDIEQHQTVDLTEEEENLLKKSRDALEAKSRLYDKLSNGTSNLTEEQEEYYRRYLVRFDKKSRVGDLPPQDSDYNNYEPPKNPDEEWIEYTDCLGRTRTCLRKDLDYVKSKDKDLKRRNRDNNRSRSRTPEPPPPEEEIKEPPAEITEENDLLSSDMRREILRQQWEKEEEELRYKSDIHYQDILFNEARTHGVGYYGFSKDEDVRAKQQEALKKLRQETKQKQKKSQELKAMREKQLAARVKAAKNRKRERMGLPPLEDEPEPESEPPPVNSKEKPEVDENEKKLEEERKKYVRPWDLGKHGLKKHEHSQEEWEDKKRRERPNEFAPLLTCRKKWGRRKSSDEEKKYRREELKATPMVNEEDSGYRAFSTSKKGAEISPPPTYDYYGASDSKRSRSSSVVSDSIEAGLKYLREQLEKRQKPK